MKDRKIGIDRGILGDRPKILGRSIGARRIRNARCSHRVRLIVVRSDVIANHFAFVGDSRGNLSRVDTVSSSFVDTLPIVGHGHTNFVGVHHAIGHFNRCDIVEGLIDFRRD